ncbi:hypothetical protein NPIL_501651 [Nephila pilipes]|uniref:Uncharacterized protein n=1 Tax=Nephila pilipes TaxID=299642 RepID=A0A8X6N3U7_NEPPI|nr:hypothetical protein NPIL_501651 [Nephila pilipes]
MLKLFEVFANHIVILKGALVQRYAPESIYDQFLRSVYSSTVRCLLHNNLPHSVLLYRRSNRTNVVELHKHGGIYQLAAVRGHMKSFL